MNINNLLDELYNENEAMVVEVENALITYAFDNLPMKEIRELNGVDVLLREDFEDYYCNNFSELVYNLTDSEAEQLSKVAQKLVEIYRSQNRFVYEHELLEILAND
jgi:hypothetical protein